MTKSIYFSCIVLASIFNSFSQNKELDTKVLDTLITFKKEMINNHDIKSFYTIQLFSGNIKSAEDVKELYESKSYSYEATIEYETPNYKVWVGNFRTKLHADKAYIELKKDYPNALVFRPGR